MQRMPKYCVDLIYLDPPFNSKQNYNLIYKNMTGLPVPDQAEAFCDTWEMDAQKEEMARSMPILMREHGIEDYYVEFWRLWINALRHTQPHLLAYLIYMVQRLIHMKSILRPTGSIFLHCDPTASHYIKVMMDGIFGHKNFRNEIIWKRRYGSSSAVHKKVFAPLFFKKRPFFPFTPPRPHPPPARTAAPLRHTRKSRRSGPRRSRCAAFPRRIRGTCGLPARRGSARRRRGGWSAGR